MLCKSSTQRSGIRWWECVLIIVGVPTLVLLIWLWLRRRAEEEAPLAIRIEITPSPHPVEVPVPTAETVPSKPDNLRRIEGIGPKISSLFQATGITTFAQLAATDVGQLKTILREAGIRTANPSTWPEQASLAAAGEWDALKALQAELRGGRRM